MYYNTTNLVGPELLDRWRKAKNQKNKIKVFLFEVGKINISTAQKQFPNMNPKSLARCCSDLQTEGYCVHDSVDRTIGDADAPIGWYNVNVNFKEVIRGNLRDVRKEILSLKEDESYLQSNLFISDYTKKLVSNRISILIKKEKSLYSDIELF